MEEITGSPGVRQTPPPPTTEGELVDRINLFEERFTLIEKYLTQLDSGVRKAQGAAADLDQKVEHFARVGDLLSEKVETLSSTVGGIDVRLNGVQQAGTVLQETVREMSNQMTVGMRELMSELRSGRTVPTTVTGTVPTTTTGSFGLAASGGMSASGSGSNQDSFEPKGINQPTRFDGTKATQVPDFIDKLVDWAEATGLGYSPGPKMSVKRYCALVSQNLAEGPATVWYKGFKAAFELKAELIYFCDELRAHFGVHFEHEMALSNFTRLGEKPSTGSLADWWTSFSSRKMKYEQTLPAADRASNIFHDLVNAVYMYHWLL